MRSNATFRVRRKAEHEIQERTVKALRDVGFAVKETTAYRQKGPSGVDKGIADLLVYHAALPVAMACCIEMKKPPARKGGPIRYSSPEQEQAHAAGMFTVATSPQEALAQAETFLRAHGAIETLAARETIALIPTVLAELLRGPVVSR